jgi:uncharacterized protein (DUF362 family)
MKKGMVIAVIFCLVCTALVWAGPKVAIVKTKNPEVALYGWKVDVLDFTKQWEAYWTKAHEEEVEAMVREAVKLAGGWPVKSGDKVVIKTNLVQDMWYVVSIGKTPNAEYANKFIQSMLVNGSVVRAVALLAKESAGPTGKVTIVCGPNASNGYAAFDAYGYTKMAKEIGVELYDVSDGPWKVYRAPKGLALKTYTLPTKVVEADVQICMGPMKTHELGGVTLTLKNWGIGIPPGKVYGAIKLGLPHHKIAYTVTDVHMISKVDYAIVDGLWGMELHGPTAGEPVEMGLIIAGADPVAVDSVGTMCMGFVPWHYGIIRTCKEYGVGTYDDIEVVGEKIDDVMKMFKPCQKQFRAPSAWNLNKGWD